MYRQRLRETKGDIVKLKTAMNNSAVRLLKADLAVAITFAHIGVQLNDPRRKAANAEKARKIYDSILHFLPRVTVSESEAQFIQEELEELKSNLVKLGESF